MRQKSRVETENDSKEHADLEFLAMPVFVIVYKANVKNMPHRVLY